MGSGGIDAVSYTHLDVYKRQVRNCVSFVVARARTHIVPRAVREALFEHGMIWVRARGVGWNVSFDTSTVHQDLYSTRAKVGAQSPEAWTYSRRVFCGAKRSHTRRDYVQAAGVRARTERMVRFLQF